MTGVLSGTKEDVSYCGSSEEEFNAQWSSKTWMKHKAVLRDIIFPALFSNISRMVLPWKTWSFGNSSLRKALQTQTGAKEVRERMRISADEGGFLIIYRKKWQYQDVTILQGYLGGRSARGRKGKEINSGLGFFYFVHAEVNRLKSQRSVCEYLDFNNQE